MTIEIPIDLETVILAAVQGGRFASVDEAMAEAARLLVANLKSPPTDEPASGESPAVDPDHDPILGLFHDDAELMDEIVADLYRQRQPEAEREVGVE